MEISSAIAGSLLEKMENPRVNDVVLVAEDNVPRHRWRLGIVVEALPGQDGLLRTNPIAVRDNGSCPWRGGSSGHPELFHASYGRDNLLISGTGYEGHRQVASQPFSGVSFRAVGQTVKTERRCHAEERDDAHMIVHLDDVVHPGHIM
ncbi:hypothetical protein TTRE_0000870401 [Trichuris trichiura]|uniref:DUF5641 domain-containing protein n=1 Tax=Trichuris trichiura TaxID=36087 RepID=A0A077ZIU6_TRITR|nr:hypothetical protein TTRE_0000870401 [Trichuris trichiura]